MIARLDDMTLAEAQAEAERRWPGAVLVYNQRHDHHELCIPVPLPGIYYEAQTPVGCLDQAIAAEARRTTTEYEARIVAVVDAAKAEGRRPPECNCDAPWEEVFGAPCELHPRKAP